jgi:hypothetical protein
MPFVGVAKMSQVKLRLRRIGLGILLVYWAVAGVVGTLTLTSAVTQRIAVHERFRFADQMLTVFMFGHRVELCPDACFTQDHRQYQGIQILPDPNKKE